MAIINRKIVSQNMFPRVSEHYLFSILIIRLFNKLVVRMEAGKNG